MEMGYARVSTTKQDLDRQLDTLTTAGVDPQRIYVDKKSGATTDRPGLAALLDYARDGDVLVVHALDRLGRTVRDTLNLIPDLNERGVGVRNLADPIRIDSSDPDDRTPTIRWHSWRWYCWPCSGRETGLHPRHQSDVWPAHLTECVVGEFTGRSWRDQRCSAGQSQCEEFLRGRSNDNTVRPSGAGPSWGWPGEGSEEGRLSVCGDAITTSW